MEPELHVRLLDLVRRLAMEEGCYERWLRARLAAIASFSGPMRSRYVRDRVALADIAWVESRHARLLQSRERAAGAGVAGGEGGDLRVRIAQARRDRELLRALYVAAWAERVSA
jgi:hypothetical protein